MCIYYNIIMKFVYIKYSHKSNKNTFQIDFKICIHYSNYDKSIIINIKKWPIKNSFNYFIN